MDIYLSPAINVHNYITLIDKALLRVIYRFSFRPGFDAEHDPSPIKRLINSLFQRRLRFLAGELTKEYMKKIYSHVSVNLSHVASQLIFYNIIKKKVFHIEKKKFYLLLYSAIKEMQGEKKIILHRHLKYPDRYSGLLDGKNEFLDQFMEMAREGGLLNISEDKFSFLPELLEEFEFDSIRLKNTPRVLFNEVQPIKQVRNIVKNVVDNFKHFEKKRLPEHLYDDDKKRYFLDRDKFSGPDYEKINKRETKTLSGEPFFLKSSNLFKKKTGILLIHGFPASPAEMRPLGEFFNKNGYTVYGARLKGHGTSPYDLDQTPWGDCVESIEHGYKVLSLYCKKIIVVGFSIGGVVALDLVSKSRDNICGIVSISASIEVEGMDKVSLTLSAYVEKLIKIVPGVKTKFLEWDTESPKINYRSVPLQKVMDLKNYIDRVKEQLKSVSIPILIIQGTKDPLVKHHSADFIYETVSSKDKEIYWYESDKHIIVTENCTEVYKNALSFIKKL